MILRTIAESDYHYDASIAKHWTFYQYRMYVCDKDMISDRRQFATVDEAIAFRNAQKTAAEKNRLHEFSNAERAER